MILDMCRRSARLLRPRRVIHEFRERQHRGRQRPRSPGPRAGQCGDDAGLRQRRDHRSGSRRASRRSSNARSRSSSSPPAPPPMRSRSPRRCRPTGSCVCHREAHVIDDECGAPEFFMHGAKLAGLPGRRRQADGRGRRRLSDEPAQGRQADAAEGALDLAGDRVRHGLRPRRDRGPRRGLPRARPVLPHGRRALRQRPRVPRLHARPR